MGSHKLLAEDAVSAEVDEDERSVCWVAILCYTDPHDSGLGKHEKGQVEGEPKVAE